MTVNIREKNQGSVWALIMCNYLTHIDAKTLNLIMFGQFLQKNNCPLLYSIDFRTVKTESRLF